VHSSDPDSDRQTERVSVLIGAQLKKLPVTNCLSRDCEGYRALDTRDFARGNFKLYGHISAADLTMLLARWGLLV
jgi:hypothetical protein